MLQENLVVEHHGQVKRQVLLAVDGSHQVGARTRRLGPEGEIRRPQALSVVVIEHRHACRVPSREVSLFGDAPADGAVLCLGWEGPRGNLLPLGRVRLAEVEVLLDDGVVGVGQDERLHSRLEESGFLAFLRAGSVSRLVALVVGLVGAAVLQGARVDRAAAPEVVELADVEGLACIALRVVARAQGQARVGSVCDGGRGREGSGQRQADQARCHTEGRCAEQHDG